MGGRSCWGATPPVPSPAIRLHRPRRLSFVACGARGRSTAATALETRPSTWQRSTASRRCCGRSSRRATRACAAVPTPSCHAHAFAALIPTTPAAGPMLQDPEVKALPAMPRVSAALTTLALLQIARTPHRWLVAVPTYPGGRRGRHAQHEWHHAPLRRGPAWAIGGVVMPPLPFVTLGGTPADLWDSGA